MVDTVMSDYIVEFKKGDKVLEKKKFSSLDGRDGAELYIWMNSFDKNLDKEYNWIIRQEHGDWFKKYDNNGVLVSLCGIDPLQLILNNVVPSLKFELGDSSKQEEVVSMEPIVCRRIEGKVHTATLLVYEDGTRKVNCSGGCSDCLYGDVE